VSSEHDIAIVGMAGRFPGAADIDAFWRNLVNGVGSIVPLSDARLREAGVSDDDLREPTYVKASAHIDGVDRFDAKFFGYTAAEAARMDPQFRLFLELAWNAFEHAGLDPSRTPGPIGVYAGTAGNDYYVRNLAPNPDAVDRRGDFQVYYANRDDFLTTSVAYKLDLRGPAVTVRTFCSTALVATHIACQNLLDGECDVALAGGAAIRVPTVSGYFHWPGGITSRDGKVRPFDADADGTVFGSGLGAVVLMRLDDALRDGFSVHAVIRGSAINNDGALKAGYTSPSLEGQAAVVVEAMAAADVEPDSIGFVEAHGTGTNLGDPIEVAALTRAYRSGTERRGYCRLGSVKGNIGHINAAAGAAALIKVVLALKHERIPPTLHFERANPVIDFPSTPFVVNDRVEPWPRGAEPRRAGVSSLGFGGTNAHLILEEAPPPERAGPSRNRSLLVVSARTATALRARCEAIADYLERETEQELDDVAWTLQVGRRPMAYRIAIVVGSRAEAIEQLRRGPAVVHCETRADAPALPIEFEPRLRAAADAFCAGAELDWAQLHGNARRRRLALPGYPFEGLRYWIDSPIDNPAERRPLARWCYRNAWRQERVPSRTEARWVVLGADDRHAALLDALSSAGQRWRRGVLAELALQDDEGVLDLRGLDGFAPAQVIALGRALARRPTRVVFAAHAAVAVSPGEPLDPRAHAASAIAAVLAHERPELDVRVIDLPTGTSSARGLAAELSSGREPCVALRGVQRWIPAPLPLDDLPARTFAGEAWWIVGTGSIAASLARHLVDRGCRVAVTGASVEGAISVALDLDSARAAIGALDGVVHAGLPRGVSTFAVLFEPTFTPGSDLPEAGDVQELERLAELVREVPRRLLLSSLAGQLGGYGFGRVAAASAFAEAWARRHGWASVMLDVRADDLAGGRRSDAITPDEERQLFDRLLGLELDDHLLVSTTELGHRLRRDSITNSQSSTPAGERQPRPELDTPFVAPRDEEQQRLAKIWCDLFELDAVGIDDDFFALGGHSLLITQLSSRIRDKFGLELPVAELFEHPTVAGQVERLRARATASSPDAAKQRLAARVAQMSPEQVRELLARKRATP
jgi:3-oxoacyl-(acyl-carrier-protein) synthase/acyl carrier protein